MNTEKQENQQENTPLKIWMVWFSYKQYELVYGAYLTEDDADRCISYYSRNNFEGLLKIEKEEIEVETWTKR
jgi:hypothetical protein